MRPQLTRRPPPEQEVLRRVPARLAEVYTHIAARELTRWREDHLPDRITVIQSLLDKIDALHLTSYLPTLLRSICLFLRHDVRSSMAELRKCKGELELTWRVNLAFLYAYEGDLNSARREMQIAARGQLSEATPNQAEQFILWVLDEEPEKTHLWYLLGLINYLLKGDFDQAQADFKRFLSVADRTCFGSAVQHAQTLARKVPAAAT
jgi:tetratricopeptide (TPR) repeat protein